MKYRYGIQGDSSGLPSGTWLGYKDLATAGVSKWVVADLTPDVDLTSGTVYHIVVEPVDNPNKSIALRATAPLNQLIVYDQAPDPNSNTLFYDGTGWTIQGYQPLYLLEYSDAIREGDPCSDPGYGSVYGSIYESERFTWAGGDKTITQVIVYLKCAGSPPNDCRFVLYNITDAVEVANGTIATSSEITTSYAWYTYTLSTPQTLIDGKQYRLYLKTPGGNSSNKYMWHMPFNNGVAGNSRNYDGLNSINQTSSDGGSSWADWPNFDAVFRFAYPATYYYVRPDGNNANTGRGPSAAAAWKTIGKAASTMVAGDTVYVAPGNYGESVSVGNNGSAGKRINYVGDRDASEFPDLSAGEVITSRFSISSKSYITIDGFTLRNYSSGSGVEVLGTGNNYLIIRNNKIYSHSYDGIHLRYANNIEIYNNLIYDNERHGINLFYTSNNAKIYNNTFYLNADVSNEAAIKLDQGQNATVFNNIFYQSIGYCIYVSDQSGFASDYNDFYGGAKVGYWSGDRVTLADWCGASTQTDDINHAINSDPKFVDPDGADNTLGGPNGADDDFHLQSTSPCIEAGTSSFNGKSAPADDIDGEVRPYAAGYDMGSDELLIALSITLRNAADNADYTTWTIGSGKALNTVYLMDINNCVLVKNDGNVSEDFSIMAVGSNWTLGSSSGENTCVLMGLFNGHTAPLEGDFSTANDLINTFPVWATQVGGSGKFEGTNDGDNILSATGEKLYIYLRTPTAVNQGDQEAVTVTIGCREH
ncbi:MAG: right-handed parallel beta-helix repeat-containing protein [bacterium]